MGNSLAKEMEEREYRYRYQMRELESRAASMEKQVESLQEEEQVLIKEKERLLSTQMELSNKCENLYQQTVKLTETQQELNKKLTELLEERDAKDQQYKDLRAKLEHQERYRPPNHKEHEEAKLRINYRLGCLHIAVAGTAGVGKSSLLNAIRGVKKTDPEAAATGYTETTSVIGRYPGHADSNVIFYDVPGGGTLNIQRWDYFKQQGLYLMQAVIIVWCDRIMDIDVEIMHCCIIAGIPFFLVRTKCDQQMDNFRDDVKDELDLEDDDRTNPIYLRALADKVIEFHCRTVKYCQEYIPRAFKMAGADFPKDFPFEQRIFLVNYRSLYRWITQRYEDANALDEKYLANRICREIIKHGMATDRSTKSPSKKESRRAVSVKS